jgi:hypothetical protein
VTRSLGKALAAVVGLVETVVAWQQGKGFCAEQQHATVGQAVLSVEVKVKASNKSIYQSKPHVLFFFSHTTPPGRDNINM